MFWSKKTITLVLLLLGFCCGSLNARPTTVQEAEKVVTGWLKADAQPLDTVLGQDVAKVETFTNDNREPIYYIVYLEPSGFVIVPADDLIEPIIGFVDEGTYDPSLDNPLGALVTNDLNGRIAAVRDMQRLKATAAMEMAFECQAKWEQFIRLADGPMAMGLTSISDVRVAPFVKSKWWQWTCCEAPELACYNYYTPPFTTPDGDPNNYICGCVATAMAQVIRYYQYPTEGIGVHVNTVYVDDVPKTAYTRGGDGSGGPYNWSLMLYEPNCSTPEVQRQAIGALCYDAGVVLGIHYSSSFSWVDTLRIKDALTTIFQYGNAVKGYKGGSDIGAGLIGMLNPNLDAKEPVILRIVPGTGAHAVVCDGYGYNLSTLYHHINMGWGGNYDAWYNLPTIEIDPYPPYTAVTGCIYNIHVTKVGDGEMISGRVLDHNGQPIANAAVYAKSGIEIIGETESDSKGIYAFDCLESNTTYTVDVAAKGYGFFSQEVSTGISIDNTAVSGNVWGVDLVGRLVDFNGDWIINFKDYSILAQYWLQNEPSVDIALSPDSNCIIDHRDLAVFAGNWLEVPQILPSQASNPKPADGATDVDLDADLSWKAGDTVALHEVYFGSVPYDVPLVVMQPAGQESYDPGDPNLIPSTTYYWWINEVNDAGPPPGRWPGVLWSFTTIPGKAHTPSPADGAVIGGEEIEYPPGSGNWYIYTRLIFGEGPTAVKHTGYFSEDYNDVVNRVQDANLGPPPYGSIPGYETTYYAGNPMVQPANDTLVRGMTYYWCVDEAGADGHTYPGDIWDFTIQGFYAFAPNPTNDAILVDPNVVLSWGEGYGVQEHDIYLGTSLDDVNNADTDDITGIYRGFRMTPNYPCSNLELTTKFYWRVDEVSAYGTITGTVWSFTTMMSPPPLGQVGNPNPTDGAKGFGFLTDSLLTGG